MRVQTDAALARSVLGALAVLASLVACTSATPSPVDTLSASPGTATSSRAPEPSLLPQVSLQLDDPPPGCAGPSPRPQTVAPAYGKVIGGGPLWGGFYAEWDRGARAFHASDAPRTELGWRVKVLWLIDPNRSEAMTVEGADSSSGEDLWFEIEGQTPTTGLRLDPRNPGVPVEEGHWREFPSYVYFPRAGCYRLHARWSSGDWDIGFGLGR